MLRTGEATADGVSTGSVTIAAGSTADTAFDAAANPPQAKTPQQAAGETAAAAPGSPTRDALPGSRDAGGRRRRET